MVHGESLTKGRIKEEKLQIQNQPALRNPSALHEIIPQNYGTLAGARVRASGRQVLQNRLRLPGWI